MKRPLSILLLLYLTVLMSCSPDGADHSRIDRFALVTRHNVVLNSIDTLGSLSVGNGEFAFTVDVSGLQTFPEVYEKGISLGTQSQWGWHSIPSDRSYSVEDISADYESCDGTSAPYAVQSSGRNNTATGYLRANPHRLHLGLAGLILLKENGQEVEVSELTDVKQTLDLWTGKIESVYKIEGLPVAVTLYAHQRHDGISARIASPLISSGRLKVRITFPYGKECHVCPGYDFASVDKHASTIISEKENTAVIRRELDSTVYYTGVNWEGQGNFDKRSSHQFVLEPDISRSEFSFSVSFNAEDTLSPFRFEETESSSKKGWENFWLSGAAIDFSEATDPRAKELERRIVLSQYLTKIQCSGSMPPQETGLTMNSWYGKFHLEMHWWHAAHFALWGRPELMQPGLDWYKTVLNKAIATAQWQGYEGARWQKMTDPYGNESPSDIGAFIIWQQPHPIYLAELLYRHDSSEAVLHRYNDIVFATAEFMASFMKLKDGKYQLCHPLIPAQEIFKPESTDNPAFELQYWYHGLATAQQWRQRLGMPVNGRWSEILNNIVPLATRDSLYLPTSTSPEAYSDDHYRRDHPSVVAAYGMLPLNERIDPMLMRKTFLNIMSRWQWESTWGWDYPMLAMTAARLGRGEDAIDALLMNVQKNTYLVNGHNYQDDRLRLYLPGNGGLLAAVGMMAGGWDGSTGDAPGFPDNGKWKIRHEGFFKMP